MFVAIILVCAQAIVQEMRDCTLESASEIVKLSDPFFTEDECIAQLYWAALGFSTK